MRSLTSELDVCRLERGYKTRLISSYDLTTTESDGSLTFMDTTKIQDDAAKFVNDLHDKLQTDLDTTYKSADERLLAAIRKIRDGED